jgi:hypothetical protein
MFFLNSFSPPPHTRTAVQRPPTFASVLFVLCAPEGVYCFRTPLPLRLERENVDGQARLNGGQTKQF